MAINVLSLFDGMSCGQIALNRVGIKYDKYFASEIDKHAIKVTMANYPDTIQLGSVVDIKAEQLPKIDLLFGGSPCQSFSFAGKRNGMTTKSNERIVTLEQYIEYKNNGFEFEGQSYLFWEYVRVLNEVKPTYFLLENVLMEERWEHVISQTLGVHPIMINSSLLSAQNRKRLYWTNIALEPQGLFGDLTSTIKQPKDKGILLKDILEKEVEEKYYLSDKMINYFNNRQLKGKNSFNSGKVNYKDGNDKASCITKSSSSLDITDNIITENGKPDPIIIAQRGRDSQDEGVKYSQQLEIREDGKTNCLTTVQKDNLVFENYDINTNNVNACDFRSDEGFRFRKDQKSPTLMARGNQDLWSQPMIIDKNNERKIIQHDIPEIVSVRKYEVNIEALQQTLKLHKEQLKYTIQEIADKLNVPKTMVEHWFRNDTYFSIPDKDIWIKLKGVLNIQTNEFDDSIMIFEEREGTFEKSNRVYDENGIAPTLTSTSADEKILVREEDKDEDILCISSKQKNATISENKSTPMVAAMGMGGGHVPMIVSKKELNENQLAKLNPNVDTDKSNTLTLAHGRAGSSSEYMESVSKVAKITSKIRRLTPIECERLQTVPDNYTNFVSNSSRYKMLGNGWTVDVICHIFNYLPEDFKNKL